MLAEPFNSLNNNLCFVCLLSYWFCLGSCIVAVLKGCSLLMFYKTELSCLYGGHFLQVGTKVDDYWEPGKALLQDPGRFLESLFKYDKVKFPSFSSLNLLRY